MFKKTFVLVLALLLVVVGVVSAQSGNLPGSGWWSGQQIQNVATTGNASVLFTAYDAAGKDYACGVAKTAAPGQSVNFLTNTDCTVPAGFVGSAVVSADQPIAAIVNVVNMPSGTAAGMYRGTDGADVANSIAFPLMKSNFFGRSTTLYIQNASSSPNTIDVTVTVGSATFTKKFTNVPANAMVLVGPADTTPAMANNTYGSATVTGTGPLAGAALEYQTAVALGSNLHAYTAFAPSDFAPTAYCPLIRSNYARLNTGIQAQNVSSTAQAIQVTYSYRMNNTGAVVTKVVTSGSIAPNAAATFRTWDDLPAGAVGGATVKGVNNGNIAVIVNDETFSLNPNRVTAYTCFPDTAKTNKIALPLYKEYYLGDTSGVQVQNVGGAAASISVTYYPPGNAAGVKFTQNNIAVGGSATFYNVSGGTAASGNAASLLGTFGGAVVTSDQPVVAIVNEEPGTKAGARPASSQDAKLYEGFNQ